MSPSDPESNVSTVGAPSLQLNSGYRMPCLGFGTLGGHGDAPRAADAPLTMARAVGLALEAGYRHLDCAECYRNEAEIGAALRDAFAGGLLARDELFVTSKVWNTNHAKEHVRQACIRTLTNLGLEYLDLYLVHWPVAFRHTGPDLQPDVPRDERGIVESAKVPLQETWAAMEALVDEGLARSIGVSNYSTVELSDLLTYCRIPPAVNQVECHPYLQQRSLRKLCSAMGCAIVAFSSLGGPVNQGRPCERRLLDDEALKGVAVARGWTVAQLILRFLLQEGLAVIPKSSSEARLRENLGAGALPPLAEEELAAIRGLDCGARYNNFDWAFGGGMVFGA